MVKLRNIPVWVTQKSRSTSKLFDFYFKKSFLKPVNENRIFEYVKTKYKHLGDLAQSRLDSGRCSLVLFGESDHHVNSIDCLLSFHELATDVYFDSFQQALVKSIARAIIRRPMSLQSCFENFTVDKMNYFLQIIFQISEQELLTNQTVRLSLLESFLELACFTRLDMQLLSGLFTRWVPRDRLRRAEHSLHHFLYLLALFARKTPSAKQCVLGILDRIRQNCPILLRNRSVKNRIFEVSSFDAEDEDWKTIFVSKLVGDWKALESVICSQKFNHADTRDLNLFRAFFCANFMRKLEEQVDPAHLFIYLCRIFGNKKEFESEIYDLVKHQLSGLMHSLSDDTSRLHFIRERLFEFPRATLELLLENGPINSFLDLENALIKRMDHSNPNPKNKFIQRPKPVKKKPKKNRKLLMSMVMDLGSQSLSNRDALFRSHRVRPHSKTQRQSVHTQRPRKPRPRDLQSRKGAAESQRETRNKTTSRVQKRRLISSKPQHKKPRNNILREKLNSIIGKIEGASQDKKKEYNLGNLSELQLADVVGELIDKSRLIKRIKQLEDKVQYLLAKKEELRKKNQQLLKKRIKKKTEKNKANDEKKEKEKNGKSRNCEWILSETDPFEYSSAQIPKTGHEDNSTKILIPDQEDDITNQKVLTAENLQSLSLSSLREKKCSLQDSQTEKKVDEIEKKREDLDDEEIVKLIKNYFRKKQDQINKSVIGSELNEKNEINKSSLANLPKQKEVSKHNQKRRLKGSDTIKGTSQRVYIKLLENKNKFLNTIISEFLSV